MAISATFIGINKYSDPNILDLSGAVRDATALWALFTDSVPGLQAELILDEEATVDKVFEILNTKLASAAPEDTVIISFAGHGSHDHRILCHDSLETDLTKTSILMTELVERFKSSPAKTVLCFLDCCFSGEAPARVLGTSPVSRDHQNPFQMITGKGRVLIAAANFDEMAYEFPGGGHGLLTSALIEVLQEGDGYCDVQNAMTEVMSRVRASASKLGYTQTPVLYGLVEGGLTLPVLKPGKNFLDRFPEVKGAKVGSAIGELKAFGFPSEILNEWSDRFKGGLNELQLAAVNERRILDGKSLFVVAPTSSGKTFIGEMAAVKAVLKGQKAVFLLPYKALVNEKYDQFSYLYGELLGLRINRCTGDRLDGTGPFLNGKYDISLLTYEMFLGLSTSYPHVLNHIGLVVVDEGQFITDPKRGIAVELLLTLLITAREKGVTPQLIVLSAVIGNINSFDEWLGTDKLVTYTRPVPLTEGVLDRTGTFQFVDSEGNTKTERMLPFGAVVQRKTKPSSQDVIVPLVKHLLAENPDEQIIIFRNIRGSAEGCAAYLADELGLQPKPDVVDRLPKHDLTSSSLKLRKCLSGGTAFHNTNLFPAEKEVVEKAFRNPAEGIKVLGSTTTLAAGINTPASTVILAEQEFKGEEGREFTIAEYKNMAGRAGRLGFNEEGKSIILVDTPYERQNLFNKYVLGDLEPLRSSFDPKHLETWILRLLAQIGHVKRAEVVKLLGNTYGGFLRAKNYPEWYPETEKKLNNLLNEFIKLELVEEEGETVKLTLLGQVCGRSTLQYPSMMRLINLLKSTGAETLSIEMLSIIIQGLPELDSIGIPLAKTRGKEARKPIQTETGWPGLAAQRYGSDIVRILQKNADDFFVYYSRSKRALILDDWIQGKPLENIEQNYTVNFFNPVSFGHVKSLADTTRFHLRAAHQIASVIFINQPTDENAVETYLKQLEEGLPLDALPLLEIPVTLGRGEYLALYNSGIRTVDDLWSARAEKLAELLSPERILEIDKLRSS